MSTVTPVPSASNKRLLVCGAWLIVLVVSDLPNILSQTFFGEVPGWFFWGKLGFLLVLLILSLSWRPLNRLVPYVSILLAFLLAMLLVPGMLNIGITVVMMAVLWTLKRRPGYRDV